MPSAGLVVQERVNKDGKMRRRNGLSGDELSPLNSKKQVIIVAIERVEK